MKKDEVWSSYFEDDERFADFVNCFGCDGVQYVQQNFQVMSNYTHAEQLIKQTEEHEEGECYNMCKAIDDLIEDGRMEGRVELIEKMLGKGKSAEDIADLCDLELEEVQQIAERVFIR